MCRGSPFGECDALGISSSITFHLSSPSEGSCSSGYCKRGILPKRMQFLWSGRQAVWFLLWTRPNRGCTRGDTHTQMRSMTHQMRSDTPGKNVSFSFLGVLQINLKLRHRLRAWWCHVTCHNCFLITTTTAICLCVPHHPPCSLPAHLAPSLWPTRTNRTVTGPFRSGEFPLFSPLFANNPPPSPHASPLALVNTHQGKARVLFPPRAMLAASTRPCTPCFKPCQPPPLQMQPSD